jgi:hypothetical protein
MEALERIVKWGVGGGGDICFLFQINLCHIRDVGDTGQNENVGCIKDEAMV